MVKSFAHKIDGGWLKSPASSTIQNTSYRFNGEADPLYKKVVEANHKTEAERRAEQSSGEGDGSAEKAPHHRKASNPKPVLKPRSQQGRGNAEAPQWLNAQYQRALRTAKSRPLPNADPDTALRIQRGSTPSR